MGQPVTVLKSSSARPGVWRFQINRSLTGMGHESYRSAEDAVADRPPDELARRLFGTGLVESVHINSNIITCDLVKGTEAEGLVETIEGLFLHYVDGVVPPTDEELASPAS